MGFEISNVAKPRLLTANWIDLRDLLAQNARAKAHQMVFPVALC
jgi:hypothetical protein